MRKTTSLTIEQKLASGGCLTIPEFCDWAGISRVTAYKEISEGRLKTIKVGRSRKATGPDALEWRDALRGIAA
jgi:predicted DNA-binding transcriptional regulator AlpA